MTIHRRDTVAVETLARLAISRIIGLYSKVRLAPCIAPRTICSRPIEKLPDRLRHTTARRGPKDHARHLFRSAFRFFLREKPPANDTQLKRVSRQCLGQAQSASDQPSARENRWPPLPRHNNHWHRTDCLCSLQNHGQLGKRRPKRAKLHTKTALFQPRKKCCCKKRCCLTSHANPKKATGPLNDVARRK